MYVRVGLLPLYPVLITTLIFQTGKWNRGGKDNTPGKGTLLKTLLKQLFKTHGIRSPKFSLVASMELILVCPSVLWAGCEE